MTIQTLAPGWIPLPFVGDTITTFGTTTIDAASEKAAFIVEAPETGTIDRVCFRTGTVTTGETVLVRLETVDLATGDPSGTLLAVGSEGTQIILLTDDNVWFETTLTTPVAVTQGQKIAIVIALPAVTTGNMQISKFFAAGFGQSYPYCDVFTGAWIKSAQRPVCALRYNDGTYPFMHGVTSATTITAVTYNNTSSPDEHATRINLAAPKRVLGFWANVTNTADWDAVLYEGTTAQRTASYDAQFATPGSGRFTQGFFDSPLTLTKNTDYYLSVKPTTATDITVPYLSVSSAALMEVMGVNIYGATRVDAGAWTDETTRRYQVGLLVDGADDGGLAMVARGTKRA